MGCGFAVFFAFIRGAHYRTLWSSPRLLNPAIAAGESHVSSRGAVLCFIRSDKQSEAPCRDTNIVFSSQSQLPRKPSWHGLTNWIVNSRIAIQNTAVMWFVKRCMNFIWHD